MKKGIAGVIVGAIVYFIWGALSWTVLPWHAATAKPLPQELLITDTMKTVIKEPGFYVFPSGDMKSNDPQEKTKWEDKYRRGPLGAVVFSPAGREPMAPSTFVAQFLSNVCQAALVMFVLFAARDRYKSVLCRATLAGALGLLAGVAVHVQHLIWFTFPLDFTVVNILDLIIGFTIMGAVMAKFVANDEGAR